MYNIRGYIYLYTKKLKFNSSYLYNFNPNQLEMSLQQMTLHKRLKRKNEDGIEGGEIENNQSVDEAAKLMSLLHRYARENLLLANIYIKVRINILTKNRYLKQDILIKTQFIIGQILQDPAVEVVKKDQKIPVIWFVANVGGILGLCMGCSLVTIFEVLHHVTLILLRTSAKGVSKVNYKIASSCFYCF